MASTAAGPIKRALVRAEGPLAELGAHDVLLNRDEVLVDAPELRVPLAVHVGVGDPWLSAKGAAS